MSSLSQELRKVSFTPKHEASFLCPESELDALLDFLASKHVAVTRREAGAASDSSQIIVVEVSDIDFSEGERLQKEFNASLQ